MTYCARCGEVVTESHNRCAELLRLEPPRYCVECGRRMVVQVTPASWVAVCSRHGEVRPQAQSATNADELRTTNRGNR